MCDANRVLYESRIQSKDSTIQDLEQQTDLLKQVMQNDSIIDADRAHQITLLQTDLNKTKKKLRGEKRKKIFIGAVGIIATGYLLFKN